MAKKSPGKKFEKVMGEYGRGALHSGRSGRTVRDREQALAIAFSEQRANAGARSRRRRKS